MSASKRELVLRKGRFWLNNVRAHTHTHAHDGAIVLRYDRNRIQYNKIINFLFVSCRSRVISDCCSVDSGETMKSFRDLWPCTRYCAGGKRWVFGNGQTNRKPRFPCSPWPVFRTSETQNRPISVVEFRAVYGASTASDSTVSGRMRLFNKGRKSKTNRSGEHCV